MKRTLRLLAFYLAGVLALSSVDLSYEWFSPLHSKEEPSANWYATAGLRGGAFGVGNDDTGPAAGLEFNVHAPQFVPLPFYAGGGPEGGAVVVSIWFLGLLGWGIHVLWRQPTRRRISDREARA